MTKRALAILTLAVVWLAGCNAPGTSFPDFTGPVVDATNTLNRDTIASVSSQLEQFRTTGGPQIAVAVIDSVGTSSIEDYTIDLAREWGVGDKAKDDGVVLLIALEDRELRIEVGSGVEGDLTDVTAGQIIDQVITPQLKAGNVDAAVRDGANALMKVWKGEPVPNTPTTVPPSETISDTTPVYVNAIVFLLFAGFIALGIFSRFRRGIFMGPFGSGTIYGGGHGWSSGGFGGGGGGFSGGGASGRW